MKIKQGYLRGLELEKKQTLEQYVEQAKKTQVEYKDWPELKRVRLLNIFTAVYKSDVNIDAYCEAIKEQSE